MKGLVVEEISLDAEMLLQRIEDFRKSDQLFMTELGKQIHKAYGPAEKEVIGETFYSGNVGTHDSIDYEGK